MNTAEQANAQKIAEAGSYLKIDQKALRSNLLVLKKQLKPNTKVMAMVKAVAYGHGAVLMAKHLEENKLVDCFGVASIDKGIELREMGIELPILIFNPISSGFHRLIEHCLEPVLHNEYLLEEFSKFVDKAQLTPPYPIHLKFNTGMNRFGFDLDELPNLLKRIAHGNWQIKSVMSHLSCSDDPKEDAFTQSQFDCFDQIIAAFQQNTKLQPLYHILNSNGSLRFPEKQYDMVRLGIGMYGATEFEPAKKLLQPIARFYSKLTEIRLVKKGASISYSRSGRAKKDSYIGTLCIGYADGFPRSLGNGKWSVQIGNMLYPTIGNICMDYCMIDLGEAQPDAELEATVTIFGGLKTIYDYAEAQGTISYEAMTNISNRVSKVFIGE